MKLVNLLVNMIVINNIQLTDEIQTEPGQNVIPHNTHFLNNYVITSITPVVLPFMMWLTRGIWWKCDHLILLLILMEMDFLAVGVFTHGYHGLIIASDIEEGLYVLQPNYMRGAYLKVSSGTPQITKPYGVDVTILGPNQTTQTETFGNFVMGLATAGNYTVVFHTLIPKRYGIQCTSSK